MIRFILKRILALIPVLLGVSFIIFCLLYFTPGDPAEYMLGMDATEENIQELREELGLNEPFLVQYFNYIKNIVLHFDFGKSYTTKQSVTIELLQRVPATVTLAVLSVAFATIIGVVTGVIAAVKQYSIFDKLATIFALTGVSMPNFWTGLMLIIIFSVKLGWLPPLVSALQCTGFFPLSLSVWLPALQSCVKLDPQCWRLSVKITSLLPAQRDRRRS